MKNKLYMHLENEGHPILAKSVFIFLTLYPTGKDFLKSLAIDVIISIIIMFLMIAALGYIDFPAFVKTSSVAALHAPSFKAIYKLFENFAIFTFIVSVVRHILFPRSRW